MHSSLPLSHLAPFMPTPPLADLLLRKIDLEDSQFRKFQERLVQLFTQENWLISELIEKNTSLSRMINKVQCLVKQMQMMQGQEEEQQIIQAPSPNELVGQRLLQLVYGRCQSYELFLRLAVEFPHPLFKDRNFGLTVQMVDKQGNVFQNDQIVTLQLSLFTKQYPPKQVQYNNEGSRIFKGLTRQDLRKGTAEFKKIQIKEVSSHFRNSQLILTVSAKDQSSNKFDVKKIKPLIIESVVVKAKKLKEKAHS